MKRAFCLFVAVVTMLPLASFAHITTGGFTHPEIGELIVFTYSEGMPSFTIYGFTQYRIVEPGVEYRGMRAGGTNLIHNNMLTLDQSLEKMFNSIEGRTKDVPPVTFEYIGVTENFGHLLNNLPVKERIKAIRILNGFDGLAGYDNLNQINGFSSVEVDALKANHEDFTIEYNGTSYPYRVLMFYIEESDWEQVYHERYCYVQIGKEWKLCRIAKEYFSDYRQRLGYIHGLPGTDISALPSAYQQVFKEGNWHATMNEIASDEGGTIEKNKVVFKNSNLFRLPAVLTYSYSDSWLSSIEYSFTSSRAFFSAFISLYIRYYDPITINENGDMSWSLPEMVITLKYDDENPTVTITPRMETESFSVGNVSQLCEVYLV